MEYPTSPTGSLLRGFRPSLHWLFQHIRGSSDRDYVTKEDLRVMLRGEVDATDLDEAFDRLDTDGNGQITEDEFMNGFATFFVEASAAQTLEDDFDTNIGGHMYRRNSSVRRSRRKPVQELLYEAQEGEVRRPSDNFKKSLKHLSLHNRLSIEDLWKSLNESNPEAVNDFEEFVGEMAGEVQTAQNALKKQKEANRLEAMELDVEMALIQNESQAKLQQQTEMLREKAENKLEQQLQKKDEELGEIRDKLQLLENELSASRHSQAQLKHKYEESVQEREDLLDRLSTSEKLLHDSAATIDTLKSESTKQKEEQQGFAQQQEENLSELRTTYISEISELRDRLKSLQRNQEMMQYPHNGIHSNTNGDMLLPTTPDLLSTHHDNGNMGRVSPSSLLDEIVESEGATSPVLKDTMLYTSSPLALSTNQYHSNKRPPLITAHSDSDYQSGPSTIGLLPGLDHLDLASKHHPPIKPEKSVVLRSKSMRTASRPTSMYCNRLEDMDLNWPPGNWQETRQEWLAQVASADLTRFSPTHALPPPEKIPKSQRPLTNHTQLPSEAAKTPEPPTIELEESPEPPPVNIIVPPATKYFNDPKKCQPLEFVESFVVQPNQTFKILVVGNPHVGKSCFLMRLCTNTFTTRYASTIGVDFFSRAIMLNEKVISLQLWDTAGQERFQSVTRAYYRGAHGVILMYDISREDSFIAVKSWISSIQDNMDEPPAALLLLGNKVDLDDQSQREVLTETGETFAKIYGAMFAEVSAKTGYNVGSSCLQLVEKLIKEIGISDSNSKSKGMSVSSSSEKSKCSC